MKKFFVLFLSTVLITLCGCAKSEISDTKFLLNTVVSVTALCDDDTLDGAFSLCENYEDVFSRTKKGAELQKINGSNTEKEISSELSYVINRGLYFGDVSNGLFDISVCPVSSLWDFNGETLPNSEEVKNAVKNINYRDIKLSGNAVNLNGKSIDLGGIAKGYIADKLKEYFIKKGVSEAIIDLGGSITFIGKEKTVAIAKPFYENEYSGYIKVKDKSIVTSGVYQRYIKKGDKIYHHILNPKTGYAAESDLLSATVICDSATDADALATVCILKGLDGAKELIESTKNTEAVFIDVNYSAYHTSGLLKSGKNYRLKK